MVKDFIKTGKEIFNKTKKNIEDLKKDKNTEVFSVPEIPEFSQKCNEQVVHLSASSVAKSTLAILGIGILCYFIYSVSHLLILFFISLFFAATLDPAVDFFEKYKIPRPVSVLFLFLLIVLFLIFFIGSIVPVVADQISGIISSIGASILTFFTDLQNGKVVIPYIGEALNQSIVNTIQSVDFDVLIKSILENFTGYLKEIQSIAQGGLVAAGQVMNTGATVVGAIGSFLFDLILVLFLTFFIVVDRANLNNFFRSLFPLKNAKYIEEKTRSIQLKIGGWVRGQFALMVLMFILSLIGLFIIGMGEYAVTLAMIIGIGGMLPYIGPIVFLLIALPIAFNMGLFIVVKLLILYGVLQFLEGNILVPTVMNKAVGLNPIVILMAIIIGFQFLGVIGAILSVPFATAVSIFIKDFIDFQQNKK
ncbi:AI-2E family transporter [Candidatus Gracilibacteria bacterium]|nr:AI-2E family transporter [Candidatus Gracilibacteria bacterium]